MSTKTARLLATALLGIQTALLAYGASVQSPTLNEPGHLVAGLSYWMFGRFDVYKVNPPLSRLVAALPVLAANPKTDWSSYYDGPNARPEMSLGEAFVRANGQRTMWLFTIARWACIPLALLGGYVVFCWARELYGAAGGLLSLTLWCFGPNILAHGELVTPDMSAAALGVAAGWTFWRWLRQPSWLNLLVAGAVLGAAELTKTTLIVFLAVWPLAWLVYRLPEWRRSIRDWLRDLVMLAVGLIAAVYVLNLGYGFEGTFTPLGRYRFVSESLGNENGEERVPAGGGNRFANSWLAVIPVPLPKNYLLGIDLQKSDFEHYDSPSYLNGVFRDKGWWYYYLESLLIKVPLGTWLLIVLAATRRLWWRSTRAPTQAAHIHLPEGRKGIGKPPHPNPLPHSGEGTSAALLQRGDGTDASRVKIGASTAPLSLPLPVGSEVRTEATPDLRLPSAEECGREGARRGPLRQAITWRDEFLAILPSLVILTFVSSQTGFNEHMRYVLPIFGFFIVWIGRVAVVFAERQRIMQIVVSAALAWSIASSMWIYPHSLSYFNELAGGPTGGPVYLIHSNIDWGQDLVFLRRWLAMHPEARPIKLVYFGNVDPRALGFEFSAPEESFGNPKEAAKHPIPSGWYAISVNFLRGMSYSGFNGDGSRTSYGRGAFDQFRELKPVAMAGYSIYIYHVPAD